VLSVRDKFVESKMPDAVPSELAGESQGSTLAKAPMFADNNSLVANKNLATLRNNS
jgi:hypothetical protein